jgi:hypothetical protein
MESDLPTTASSCRTFNDVTDANSGTKALGARAYEPGQVSAQVGSIRIEILTGSDTTFLALGPHAPGAWLFLCSGRAYENYPKAIKVFLTCGFVG